MKLIVLACPRSGTGYMAAVLNQLGVRAGQERLFADGTVDWRQVPRNLTRFDLILHQVRNPLRVIESLTTVAGGRGMRYLWQCLRRLPGGRIATGDWIADGARIWYDWNKLAEPRAVCTYRVENTAHLAGVVLPLVLGRRLTAEETARVQAVPNNVNSRLHEGKHCRWADMPPDVLALARKYGYKTVD